MKENACSSRIIISACFPPTLWICNLSWWRGLCRWDRDYGPYDRVVILDYSTGTNLIYQVLKGRGHSPSAGRENQKRCGKTGGRKAFNHQQDWLHHCWCWAVRPKHKDCREISELVGPQPTASEATTPQSHDRKELDSVNHQMETWT